MTSRVSSVFVHSHRDVTKLLCTNALEANSDTLLHCVIVLTADSQPTSLAATRRDLHSAFHSLLAGLGQVYIVTLFSWDRYIVILFSWDKYISVFYFLDKR
jgi:hypothetical protein